MMYRLICPSSQHLSPRGLRQASDKSAGPPTPHRCPRLASQRPLVTRPTRNRNPHHPIQLPSPLVALTTHAAKVSHRSYYSLLGNIPPKLEPHPTAPKASVLAPPRPTTFRLKQHRSVRPPPPNLRYSSFSALPNLVVSKCLCRETLPFTSGRRSQLNSNVSLKSPSLGLDYESA